MPSSHEPMITLGGVSKAFDTRPDEEPVQALHGVDIDVARNEFVSMLGPSGCGKTTALRVIAGLIRPDAGRVLVDGREVTGPGPERSMVFQAFALLPWASVLDNVAFGLQLRGDDRPTRERRARELIETVGLGGFEKRLPRELSGGMQQRVGLARALAVEPKVLLMDEPFSAVDEQTRRLLQEELLRIWEQLELTVVFVTHSIAEAVLLSDRVIVMAPRPGRVTRSVEIPLSRPRGTDVTSVERSPEFAAVVAQLWDELRGLQPDREAAPA